MRRLKLGLLWTARASGLFALARYLTRDKLKVLCYHGFAAADEAAFRPLLFMRPELFERRMARLQQLHYRVIPLNDAVERLYGGKLEPDSVAITIDDGFHNTRQLAAPILAKYGFPAAVYVTTYYAEHQTPVFRLLVQYLFWKARRSTLSVVGQAWHADADVDLRDDAARLSVQDALIQYGEQLKGEDARRELTAWLARALGQDHAALERSRIFHLMSPHQLRELSEMGLSIQLHTHRHRFPDSDEAEASGEIEDNRRALGRWVDGPFEHFCYPSGEWHPRQAAWLDALGIRSSTTCLPGLNGAGTPRHALRRFLDGQDIHTLEFESALCGFSDLLKALVRLKSIT